MAIDAMAGANVTAAGNAEDSDFLGVACLLGFVGMGAGAASISAETVGGSAKDSSGLPSLSGPEALAEPMALAELATSDSLASLSGLDGFIGTGDGAGADSTAGDIGDSTSGIMIVSTEAMPPVKLSLVLMLLSVAIDSVTTDWLSSVLLSINGGGAGLRQPLIDTETTLPHITASANINTVFNSLFI